MMESKIKIINNEERFSSPKLQEICVHFCASNTKTVLFESLKGKSTNGSKLPNKLRESAVLPNELWKELLEVSDRKSADYLNLVTSINDKTSYGLRRLNFSGCTKLTDLDLYKAMRGCPYSLDIHNCTSLTKRTIGVLRKFGKNLENLHIGNSSHILPTDIYGWISALSHVHKTQRFQALANKSSPENNGQEFNHGILQLPNLRKLVIWNLHLTQMQQITLPNQSPPAVTAEDNSGGSVTVDYWEYLMRDFIHKLEYLDLSSCHEVSNLNFLLPARDNLRTLILHDVPLVYNGRCWGVLRNLPKISILDVSQFREEALVFPTPDLVLENLVTSLRNLLALDISGTNLAEFIPEPSSSKCAIKGLSSRMDNPLHFLGLLTTQHNASDRANIPALRIAGGANMEQIGTALRHYLHQANMTKRVVKELHDRLRKLGELGEYKEHFVPCRTLLRLLYQVTKFHRNDEQILTDTIAAMSCLLYRIYRPGGTPLEDFQLNEIVKSIIAIVRAYPGGTNLVVKCILLLVVVTSELNLEEDPAMAEELAITSLVMARRLMFILGTHGRDMEYFRDTVPQLMYQLLSLGPIVKEGLRNGQVMQHLCDLISDLMDKNSFPDLQTFWRILHRFADCYDYINPKSCELFLQTEGVKLCFRYIKFCGDKSKRQSQETIGILNYSQITVLALLANMVSKSNPGLESEIMKVSNLMEVMRIFDRDFSQMEGKEALLLHVACGFLANIATKKASRSLVSPSRPQILAKISKILRNGDVTMPMDLTFGGDLTMLYKMLESCDDPEVHFWSLKTFVYLLNSEPEKYGEMIAKDKRLTASNLEEICRKASLKLKKEIHSLSDSIITKIFRN